MNTPNLIHADIFFFITTIVVVFLGILLVFVLYYLAKSARAFSRIMERVEAESVKVADDIDGLRERIKEEGTKVSGLGKWIASFMLGQVMRKARGGRKSSKHSDAE